MCIVVAQSAPRTQPTLRFSHFGIPLQIRLASFTSQPPSTKLHCTSASQAGFPRQVSQSKCYSTPFSRLMIRKALTLLSQLGPSHTGTFSHMFPIADHNTKQVLELRNCVLLSSPLPLLFVSPSTYFGLNPIQKGRE